MALYNTTNKSYYEELIEEELCVDHNLIVDRYIFPIRTGIYSYSIPSWVTSIRRITYRGRQIDAFGGNEQILSGSTPYAASQGEPRQYVYNYLGQRVIRFFPTPAEDLIPDDEDPWLGSTIRNFCIMECFRTPDTSDEFKRIPSWFRPIIIKAPVILRLAQIDDQGFDRKSQARYEEKAARSRSNLLAIKKKLFSCMPKVMQPAPHLGPQKPLRPQLPWQFGRVVD